MAGEFGAFIARKRLEKDVKLKPIAETNPQTHTKQTWVYPSRIFLTLSREDVTRRIWMGWKR